MESSQRSHNERWGVSRWFVPHPSFRWYLRGVGLGALFASSFFGLASWYYNQALIDALAGHDAFTDPGVLAALSSYATLSMFVTAIGVVGATTFVVIFSIYFLHKIAGPVYRIKGHMQRLIDGAEVSELVLRKDDQLQDLCQTYNQLLHHLELFEPKPDGSPAVHAAQPD
jgi:hypothetical protein